MKIESDEQLQILDDLNKLKSDILSSGHKDRLTATWEAFERATEVAVRAGFWSTIRDSSCQFLLTSMSNHPQEQDIFTRRAPYHAISLWFLRLRTENASDSAELELGAQLDFPTRIAVRPRTDLSNFACY
jgi:hypothetical protein